MLTTDIQVFGRPTCPSCVQAKNWLASIGASFSYFEIDKDISKEDLLSMLPETRSIPVVVAFTEVFYDGLNSARQKITSFYAMTADDQNAARKALGIQPHAAESAVSE